jgi:hypothetical protein
MMTVSPVWPQNWWRRFLSWAWKPRWWRVSRFEPQNRQLWFGDLGLKITVTVSWFRPQNQAGFGLSVARQNWWGEASARHASISSGLLRMEACRARVFQSCLKTGGGTTMGGVHGTITEVALESSWRWTGRCDGLHWTLLPHLHCFQCIRPYGHSSHLVFCLGLYIGP